jgi:hypothetical protein
MDSPADVSVSIDFKLGEKIGALDARVGRVEVDLREIKQDTKEQNGKLDQLLARAESKRATWKQVTGAVTIIALVVEAAHELASWVHHA